MPLIVRMMRDFMRCFPLRLTLQHFLPPTQIRRHRLGTRAQERSYISICICKASKCPLLFSSLGVQNGIEIPLAPAPSNPETRATAPTSNSNGYHSLIQYARRVVRRGQPICEVQIAICRRAFRIKAATRTRALAGPSNNTPGSFRSVQVRTTCSLSRGLTASTVRLQQTDEPRTTTALAQAPQEACRTMLSIQEVIGTKYEGACFCLAASIPRCNLVTSNTMRSNSKNTADPGPSFVFRQSM